MKYQNLGNRGVVTDCNVRNGLKCSIHIFGLDLMIYLILPSPAVNTRDFDF